MEKGGWCLGCIIFLTDSEKAQLKSFVNTPLSITTNPPRFLLDTAKMFITCVQFRDCTPSKLAIPIQKSELTVDSQILIRKIFWFNSEILPVLVEAVLTVPGRSGTART